MGIIMDLNVRLAKMTKAMKTQLFIDNLTTIFNPQALFSDGTAQYRICLLYTSTVSISPEIFSKSGNTLLSSEDVFDETFWLRYMLSDESYCLAYDFNDCDGSKTSETVTQLVSSMALSLSCLLYTSHIREYLYHRFHEVSSCPFRE